MTSSSKFFDSLPAELTHPSIYALLLSIPLAFLYYRYFRTAETQPPKKSLSSETDKPLKTIMQPARDDLAPAKDDPFTLEQLKAFDGSDPSKPIYVAIKGGLLIVPICAPSDAWMANIYLPMNRHRIRCVS